jgi:hypothetical protein
MAPVTNIDYRQIFLVNTTASAVTIPELGLTIAANDTTEVNWEEVSSLQDDTTLRSFITAGTLVINNGSTNLSAVDGLSYIDPWSDLAANYYTATQLNSGILDTRYYTQSQITTTLGDYSTTAQITTLLGGYETISAFNAAIANYNTTTQDAALYYSQTQLNAGQLNNLYYTKTQLQTSGSASVHWGNLTNLPSTFTPPIATASVLGGVKIGSNISVAGDGTISVTFPATYVLPTASTTVLGGVKIDGSTITISNGVISATQPTPYTLPVATTSTLGGVIVGTNINVSGGVISVTFPASYVLPIATASVLGGVKQGANVSIAADGTLSIALYELSLGNPAIDGYLLSSTASGTRSWTAPYSLPTASSTVLGGVKVGSGINLTSGTISVTPYTLPAATSSTLGGVIIGTGINNSSGTISVTPYSLPAATTSTMGGVIVGTNISVSSGTISIATATTSVLGVVKPDGTTVTISGGTISVPTATSSVLGLVKPDGTIITNTAGAITVTKATTAAFGVVEIGTNIGVTSGVISVATATSSTLGLVKPDGTIITVSGGAITVANSSASAFGVVKVDGTTITASSGIISATQYVLPQATTSTLGGLIVGNGLSVSAGVVSVAWAGTGNANTSSHSDHTHANDSTIGGPYYTQTQLQTSGQAAVNWGNVTNKPTFSGNNWIAAVQSKYTGNSIPSGAVIGGTTYIAGNRLIWSAGTGANQCIYQFDGTNWTNVYTPNLNDTVVIMIDVDDANQSVDLYNGTAWVKIADPSWQTHSNLQGLNNDDHLQYLTTARHTAITGNPHATTLTQTIAADSVATGHVTVANLITLENGSDASSLHIHDARYYSQTQMQTAGQASLNWSNLTSVPTTFTPPIATSSVLGGVKQGNNISIAPDGTISSTYVYTLPAATSSTLGGVIVGSGINVSSGTISVTPYTLPVATTTVLGGVKQGSNVTIAGDGTLNVSTGAGYSLPIATAIVLGGVKIGNNVNVSGDGTISVTFPASYVLPAATSSTLGGVIIGSGINVSSGTISVTPYTLPQATSSTLGGVIAGSNINISNGVISIANYELSLGNPSTSGYILSSSATGSRSWIAPYSLPVATTTVLGGVKQGANITIAGDGTISAGNSYVLPVATTTTLGGVIVGSGINLVTSGSGSGTISVTPYTLPTASTTVLGGIKIDGTTLTISSGVLSVVAGTTTGPIATTTQLGDVKIGPGISVAQDGTISLSVPTTSSIGGIKIGAGLQAAQDATVSLIPTTALVIGGLKIGSGLQATQDGTTSLVAATASQIGGIKVGSGLSVQVDGTLAATYTYTLPNATTTTLGGVQIGNGLQASSGVISLIPASTSQMGGVQIGSGITSNSGTITLTPATASQIGGIKVGSGLSVQVDGTLAATYTYTLPQATTSTLGGIQIGSGLQASSGIASLTAATATAIGGVKIGSNINVTGDGTISVTFPASYVLPAATSSTLGGVIVGTGINVSNGTISVSAEAPLGNPSTSGYLLSSTTSGTRSWVAPYALPTATSSTLGGVIIGSGINVSSGTISVTPYSLPQATSSTLGGVIVGTNLSVTSGTISVATATTSVLGVVRPDGTTVTISGGIVSVPTATSSSLGLIKPDGTIITISSGAITVAQASTTAYGVVEIGSGINVASGVISHPTGDGNLHVPATSTTNNLKVLKSGATAGSAAWGSVAYSELTGTPTAFNPIIATTSTLGGVIVGSNISVTAGGTISIANYEPILGNPGVSGYILSSNTTGTRMWIPQYTLPIATSSVLGGVMAGTNISISGTGVISSTYSYTLPAATSSVLGGVMPDGTIITNTAGAITVAKATSSSYGVVLAGTNISVSNGIISVGIGSAAGMGVVQVDGTTITATAGKISAVQYTLPAATSSTLGGVIIGSGINNSSGTISVTPYTLPVATTSVLGGVKQGANITIAGDGTISAGNSYVLPIATASVLGGVKDGANVSIDGTGILSVATATTSVLGVMQVGNGLNVSSGVVGVTWAGTGTALTSSHSDHTHANDSTIGGPYYTQVNLQTSGQAAVNWANITNKPTFSGNNWITAVNSKYAGNTAPTGATIGSTTYTSGARLIWYSGTGANQHIYQFNGTTWADVYTPSANDTVVCAVDPDDSDQSVDLFNGTAWIKIADPAWQSHSNLTGLANDDHLQYLNTIRHGAITGNPHSTTLSQVITSDTAANGHVTVANLITLENGSDASSLHVHDGRYYTQSQINTTLGSYLTTATASSTYLPLAGGTITGNLAINGNSTIGGTETINGAMTVGGAVTINGAANFTSSLSLNGTNITSLYYTQAQLNAGQLNNLYYTQAQMNTSGGGAQLDWNNVTDKPWWLTVPGYIIGGCISINAWYTGNSAPSGATIGGVTYVTGNKLCWNNGNGHNDGIYYFNPSNVWQYLVSPQVGDSLTCANPAGDWIYTGSGWIQTSSPLWQTHANLLGLSSDDHPQYHNGTLAYTGNLNMGSNNIITSGLVDGVDVGTHNHSTGQGGTIDHTSLTSIGTNTHSAIDAHIARADIHFTVASISHSALANLTADDHLQYSRVDGTRAFTGVVSGITPTATAHLATKGYVDGAITADHDFATITGPTGFTSLTAATNGASLALATGNTALSITSSASPQTVTFTVNAGNISHSALANLSNDDHTQYLNTTRHSAITNNPHSTTLTQAIAADSTATSGGLTITDLIELQSGSDITSYNLHTHDSRYPQTTALASTTSGSSGASTIGISAISGMASTTVQAALAELKTGASTSTSLQTAYTNGQVITTASVGLPVKIDSSSGTNAPLELTNRTTTPTTNVTAGSLVVVNNVLYIYDGSRSAWLSPSKSITFGKTGGSKGSQLYAVGDVIATNSGVNLPSKSTITAFAFHTTTTGNTTMRGSIYVNNVSKYTFTVDTNGNAVSTSLNIPCNQNDTIAVIMASGSTDLQNPTINIEYCWRLA